MGPGAVCGVWDISGGVVLVGVIGGAVVVVGLVACICIWGGWCCKGCCRTGGGGPCPCG